MRRNFPSSHHTFWRKIPVRLPDTLSSNDQEHCFGGRLNLLCILVPPYLKSFISEIIGVQTLSLDGPERKCGNELFSKQADPARGNADIRHKGCGL
jgi:hypothetical protein